MLKSFDTRLSIEFFVLFKENDFEIRRTDDHGNLIRPVQIDNKKTFSIRIVNRIKHDFAIVSIITQQMNNHTSIYFNRYINLFIVKQNQIYVVTMYRQSLTTTVFLVFIMIISRFEVAYYKQFQ